MKIFKRVLTVIVIIALAAFVAFSITSGIGQFKDTEQIEGVSIETTREEPLLVDFDPSEEYVRPIGRTVYKDNVRWASMSGSGAEFDCLASYLDITLICENPGYLTDNHRPRVAVYANDDIVFDNCLFQEKTVVHVNLSDYEDEAVIRIIKLSESMYSSFGIGNISAYCKKDIEPTEEKQLKIEFIGDSITAGYGIDEENQYASFSTATENFSKTYAYLTAKKLGAEYSTVAFSGFGVLSGNSSGYYGNFDSVIFKYYDKAITNKTFSDDETADIWDNSKFAADFVVINLGTNDASYCTTQQRREAFENEYIKLLELVREKNPDAYILCILGDMNNSLFINIENAVKQYTENTGDENASAASIEFNMEENGKVISGHPSEKANAVAANELSEIINSIYTESGSAETNEGSDVRSFVDENESYNEENTGETDMSGEETSDFQDETTEQIW
ncbi:MAG: GDSL-type esterase/lipase family protein [Acutalibacteraceae bacterium]